MKFNKLLMVLIFAAVVFFTAVDNSKAINVFPDCAQVKAGVVTKTPVIGQLWYVSGNYRIVNFWTNEPGYPQNERKLFLTPSMRGVALKGGGTMYTYPYNCGIMAFEQYSQINLPVVSIQQLISEKLAIVNL